MTGAGVSPVSVDPGGAPRVRLVLGLANYASSPPHDWAELVEVARGADEAGFDRLVVSDHVAFGPSLADYSRPDLGGVEGGRQPTGPDGHWLEPLTLLTYLAARTTTIGLGTNVLLAALRRPVVLAKTVATLDVLSGGRLELGVGIGWQRAEYEAAGLEFGRRGRLLDHSLAVCTALWTGDEVDHVSPDLEFRGVRALPTPFHRGGPPVWVSGTLNPNVVSRLVRFGSGWIPWGDDARDLRAAVQRMRRLVSDQGRDPAGIGVLRYLTLVVGDDGWVDIDRTFDGVPADVEAGITDFRVPVDDPGGASTIRDRLGEVVDAFRARVLH